MNRGFRSSRGCPKSSRGTCETRHSVTAIISFPGLPFSIINLNTKRMLLENVRSLAPNQESAFVIYQMTKELQAHAKHFPRLECEFCLQNIPPMFVMKFYKQALQQPCQRPQDKRQQTTLTFRRRDHRFAVKPDVTPMPDIRIEKDSMGEMEVPVPCALWRLHPARRPEFSHQRPPVSPSVHPGDRPAQMVLRPRRTWNLDGSTRPRGR